MEFFFAYLSPELESWRANAASAVPKDFQIFMNSLASDCGSTSSHIYTKKTHINAIIHSDTRIQCHFSHTYTAWMHIIYICMHPFALIHTNVATFMRFYVHAYTRTYIFMAHMWYSIIFKRFMSGGWAEYMRLGTACVCDQISIWLCVCCRVSLLCGREVACLCFSACLCKLLLSATQIQARKSV